MIFSDKVLRSRSSTSQLFKKHFQHVKILQFIILVLNIVGTYNGNLQIDCRADFS